MELFQSFAAKLVRYKLIVYFAIKDEWKDADRVIERFKEIEIEKNRKIGSYRDILDKERERKIERGL